MLAPGTVELADAEAARAAGLSDKALEEATYVAFAFCVIDRLADALDFAPSTGRFPELDRTVAAQAWLPCRVSPRLAQPS